LRLTLAGLPRRYVPTSADVLGDQANALTPQSIIDDRRRSGIEGDLVAGLRRIGGVADATVVLPPASADPLADLARDEPPSASVQLIMQPGETLPAESVAGIRRFVASAYPGLAPDRVTVVDASGAVMGSAPTPDAAIAKERRVQSAVQSALDAVFGAGAAVVRVSVAASGAEEQTQSTRVVPHGELSADVARERGSESGKTFYKERTQRRFAYDTFSDKRVTPPDTPARISIAVFLIAMVPVRHWLARHDLKLSLWHLAAGGAVIGYVTGIVVSTGPLSVPLFLFYGLTKGAFLATEAASSLGLYFSKSVTLQRFGALTPDIALQGLSAGSSLMFGAFIARRYVLRLDADIFRLVMDGIMLAAGLSMFWNAVYSP